MLPKIATLLELLNDSGITYCHWKSNWALGETLEGETDLDLLIRRGDAAAFRGCCRVSSSWPLVFLAG